MKKIRSFISGMVLLIASGLVIGCTKDQSSIGLAHAKASETTVYAGTVTMQNLRFNPANLLIAQGGTVLWLNKDNIVHTVTSDNEAFDSGDIPAGGSFTYTFSVKGAYTYHCKYHNEMYGSVTAMVR